MGKIKLQIKLKVKNYIQNVLYAIVITLVLVWSKTIIQMKRINAQCVNFKYKATCTKYLLVLFRIL